METSEHVGYVGVGLNPHYKPPINRWRTVEVKFPVDCLAALVLDSENTGSLVSNLPAKAGGIGAASERSPGMRSPNREAWTVAETGLLSRGASPARPFGRLTAALGPRACACDAHSDSVIVLRSGPISSRATPPIESSRCGRSALTDSRLLPVTVRHALGEFLPIPKGRGFLRFRLRKVSTAIVAVASEVWPDNIELAPGQEPRRITAERPFFRVTAEDRGPAVDHEFLPDPDDPSRCLTCGVEG